MSSLWNKSKNWTVDGLVAKMQNHITYVAVDDNDIVGTAGFDGQQPDCHKLGVGSLLMRAVESLAVERGLDQLSLLSSITAQGSYRRLGCSPVSDVYHWTERTILIEKHLAKAMA